MLMSPYPWFGGKRCVADRVWSAFGKVNNYVEPFFGSGAVLLSRPDFDPCVTTIETINDADGFVANFWRALSADPEAVARYADYPVSEIDLFARHGWLVNRMARLTWSLEDPEFYDAKIAGWWIWGISAWIGDGWCSGKGPWVSNGAHIINDSDAGRGINRKLPHLGNAGHGINRTRQHLGDSGQGESISEYFKALSERMRKVRVCCGDWSRVMGESVTVKNGMTAVFLDPPYSAEAGRRKDIYSVDCGKVAHDVRRWCLENEDNPALRIVLCGYDGEHDLPGWQCEEWQLKRSLGYGAQGNGSGRENAKKERLWFSPSCIDNSHLKQDDFCFG